MFLTRCVQQLLEVSDLCNSAKPDERSVMTYVAQFFHAFSSMNKTEAEARRVAAFAEHMQSVWLSMNDYERRMSELLSSIRSLLQDWSSKPPMPPYSALKATQAAFHEHKKTKKREWVEQKTEVVTLLGNIGVKLKTYNLRDYRPPDGVRLSDMDALWEEMLNAEKERSKEINAKIRQIKEELRKRFAELANSCEANLFRISEEISALEGSLDSQLVRVKGLQARLPLIQDQLIEIASVEKQCIEANVEENDYTVYTYEDLEFELGLVQKSVTKKIAFIENQVVSRSMTNLTPAQLEEFESTFRYFDKDESNTLDIHEFQAALASLSIVYSDAEIDNIHQRIGNEEGRVTFEAFSSFLVEITKTPSRQIRFEPLSVESLVTTIRNRA
ncbi:spectrin repeat-containing protein [Atractiella rhizophila]|nr:spectrin repeat-containing protein [Atractiella rhizophila]